MYPLHHSYIHFYLPPMHATSKQSPKLHISTYKYDIAQKTKKDIKVIFLQLPKIELEFEPPKKISMECMSVVASIQKEQPTKQMTNAMELKSESYPKIQKNAQLSVQEMSVMVVDVSIETSHKEFGLQIAVVQEESDLLNFIVFEYSDLTYLYSLI